MITLYTRLSDTTNFRVDWIMIHFQVYWLAYILALVILRTRLAKKNGKFWSLEYWAFRISIQIAVFLRLNLKEMKQLREMGRS
ncbi:MAG: hypothetical protein COW19_05435 [Zetaproteobacteria bacterium CG12_big_fil_rev_8_21_14_0_65_55_1124]|nr:MAG: hypothetical protein AUJ58_00775 [Zetaproteobacteria bacterium CG1_02_55_237]PIS19675.1 MAG: hypothetical protein COT53_04510 [Zetaproteobacteria bacterium CG08_land_8_20_14_0_20_55_17]PIW42973.1 MAG: hypothetical protein COW19_05435 [Zetaproteobacteria bacterium CG12_big_fil_rev_8_21_14_0_65_55_1124]PIY54276.1 MAG: hypothetical protein COZ01_00970 [Zetaproteobacteria bacterium CG_4_10_14_0_8_um_filter_55_43]PIZ40314.1 MAG: hypothetical protein COY36_00005 [Zetaproteobacteria bacterium 